MRQIILVVCCMLLLTLGARGAASGQGSVSARAALTRTLPDLRFDNITLAEAIDFLRDVSGANIHVNWRAIEDSGIGKDTTINVRLRSVPLQKILRLVLAEAGRGNALTYYVDENVLEITTRELADRELFTRVYPVDDLLMEVPDFQPPNLTLQSASAGRGSSGGGGNPLSGAGSGNNNVMQFTRAQRAQDLIDTIQSIIQPEIWNTNGGPAAIRFWNGSIIVTAPRSVHEALSD